MDEEQYPVGKAENGKTEELKNPLVKVKSQKSKKKKKHPTELIVQKLPPSPKDFCIFCDPLCVTDLRLAIFSTLCCWMLLGFVPILVGFVSIYYAKKAESTESKKLSEKYSNISRSISWIGMLLFTACATLGIVILATCGVL